MSIHCIAVFAEKGFYATVVEYLFGCYHSVEETTLIPFMCKIIQCPSNLGYLVYVVKEVNWS